MIGIIARWSKWIVICAASVGLEPTVKANPATVPAASNEAVVQVPLTNATPPSRSNDTATAVIPTNRMPVEAMTSAELSENLRSKLELARHYRHIRVPKEAEPLLVDLLSGAAPEALKQQALLELAMAAKELGEFPRAQQIYAQYLNRWPNDLLIPEILLRQGQLFRDMGMNNLALAKFYAVMTSSLVLKNDKLEYYQRLVLSAQTEIAETHFQLGKYAEASDFFSRLLKQANPALDRPNVQYRLIRCLSAQNRDEETISQGQDFLQRYVEAPEQPEVRFHVAQALKRLGQNGEALQQVLRLLQEQKERTKEHPELWAYWQQQAGNEIGNQLYREGDYVRALSIYLGLAQMDPQPAWQLPVGYQIALTYEKLNQPQKALQSYQAILTQQTALGTNASASAQAIFEMARWRADFLQWQAGTQTNRNGASITRQARLDKPEPAPQLGNP